MTYKKLKSIGTTIGYPHITLSLKEEKGWAQGYRGAYGLRDYFN